MFMESAKQYRIGNCVLNPEGVLAKVVSIGSDHPQRVNEIICLDDKGRHFPALTPIPITQEVLENCGLIWVYPFWILPADNDEGGVSLEFAGNVVQIVFRGEKVGNYKYLHQLQNILFAVTGYDIIYNPKKS